MRLTAAKLLLDLARLLSSVEGALIRLALRISRRTLLVAGEVKVS